MQPRTTNFFVGFSISVFFIFILPLFFGNGWEEGIDTLDYNITGSYNSGFYGFIMVTLLYIFIGFLFFLIFSLTPIYKSTRQYISMWQSLHFFFLGYLSIYVALTIFFLILIGFIELSGGIKVGVLNIKLPHFL